MFLTVFCRTITEEQYTIATSNGLLNVNNVEDSKVSFFKFLCSVSLHFKCEGG